MLASKGAGGFVFACQWKPFLTCCDLLPGALAQGGE
jgi:hypothetical protein